MRSEKWYQYALIALGVVTTVFTAVFFHREVFPEYKIYQDDYIALEEFRSSYTHEPPSPFKVGVKQILIEREDKGNPTIDRCISCHVALQIPDFSPTRIAHDINGNMLLDKQGLPQQEPNPNYIWEKLDAKIAKLESSGLQGNEAEAAKLRNLKSAQVGDIDYDVTKVLRMHPLIGRETRPFEFHPIEEYGCTSCHNGNGRGLTTEKAHGPVFDGTYEKEFVGYVPQFTENDSENDPRFASIFNGKPGDALLFQTTPIFVGALIQAKCMQCHQASSQALSHAVDTADTVTNKRIKQVSAVEKGLQNDEAALLTFGALRAEVEKNGFEQTLASLKEKAKDFSLPPQKHEQISSQIAYLTASKSSQAQIAEQLQEAIEKLLGSKSLAEAFNNEMSSVWGQDSQAQQQSLDKFISDNRDNKDATGSIFAKLKALDLEKAVEQHIKDIDRSFGQALADPQAMTAIASDIDLLTYNYQRGQQLFISQACYACHRIAGMSRGGVGPELTHSGQNYPWFVKESIVWPQADLRTSTMPNYRLDHEELQDLVTFLLSQIGENKSVSDTAYKTAIQNWEAGRKQPWEQAITPLQMQDVRYAMTVFATQGCAACHRLEGFDSNVGFAVEKLSPDFDVLYAEKEWFQKLFPEDISGTDLVRKIEAHATEIDKRIVDGVRQNGLLEEIEKNHPSMIEALYTPFKYAARAKNNFFKQQKAAAASTADKTEVALREQQWKTRVKNLLAMFIQEYGLGRLIGPRPNWSGVFRTDEWLMEHFRNPTSHVPRSLMPVLPFDDTKFYALTHMLDVLGIRNRNDVRSIWQNRGFNPELAFDIHCAQCHGDHLQGNGPVSEWIYPIPKNLRNADFLRNLTKEQAVQSITHGVKGTPMPPWGEVAQDKPTADGIPVLSAPEIQQLVDWLFSALLGSNVIRSSEDVLKWRYSPEDIIRELDREGGAPQLLKTPDSQKLHSMLALPKEALWAAASQSKDGLGVATLFDISDDLVNGKSYYIKREYYTPGNIEQGRQFFELNCAVCHGKEGDGSGMRAGTMAEAKPRMLTNFDWIKTRDDLRLLRSIKYGVPGTAMTPWGDLTSSLQRLQLVMFIRSLSEQRETRDLLSEAIYRSFDRSEVVIERARTREYASLVALQEQLNNVQAQRKKAYTDVQQGEKVPEKAVELYQQELSLLAAVNKQETADQQLLKVKELIKAEKELYLRMGYLLIQNGESSDIHTYVKMLDLTADRFTFQDDKLVYNEKAEAQEQTAALSAEIIQKIDSQIDQAKKDKTVLEGKIGSSERSNQLQALNSRIGTLNTVKNQLLSDTAEVMRLKREEREAVKRKGGKAVSEERGEES